MPGSAASAARQEWLDKRASELVAAAGAVGERVVSAAGGPREGAALLQTIGLEHLHGASAFDTAARLSNVVQADWPDLVPAAISKFRGRLLPRPVAADLVGAWSTFVRAVEVGGRRPAWWADFGQAFEGRLPVRQQSSLNRTDAFDDPLLQSEGDHIDRVRNAIQLVRADPTAGSREQLRRVWNQLLPMELDAVLAPQAHVESALDVLEATARVIDAWAVMPGGWCDRLPPDDRPVVPDWLWEAVVNAGARSWKLTTGPVHTWIVVSDGDDDGAIPRLLAEVSKLGLEVDGDRVTMSLIAPRHAGDDDPVWMSYWYDASNPESVYALAALALAGTIRLEVLQIAGGSLEYLGSTRLPLPIEVCEQLGEIAMTAVANHWGGDADRIRQSMIDGHLVDQAELRFRGSENGRYELLWELSSLRPRAEVAPDARQSLEEARESLLAVWSDEARQRLRGLSPDRERAEQARSAFNMALSHARVPPEMPSPVDVLPGSGGFLHFDLGSSHIELTILANIDGDDVARTSDVALTQASARALSDLLETRHGRGDLATSDRCSVADRAVDAIDEFLAAADCDGLLAGVEQVIVSCGPDLDGLPIHACDTLRSRAVGYAPSLRFLAAVPGRLPTYDDSVVVLAHDGEGAQTLPALGHEVEALRAIYGERASFVSPATAGHFEEVSASRLHVIAHGRADADLAHRGFQLAPPGPDGFVSAADVVSREMYGLDLVYLSACSSSVADHSGTVIQSFGGVDFAFLSAGARSAIASCWDVSDTTAALMAVATHYALSQGRSAMAAYRWAQEMVRGDFATIPEELGSLLDGAWPGWNLAWSQIPSRLSALHWASFRISGVWW